MERRKLIFRRPQPATPRISFAAQLASDSYQSPEKPCPLALAHVSSSPSPALLPQPSRPKFFKKPSISRRGLSLPRFRPRLKALGAKLASDSDSSPNSSPRAFACPYLGVAHSAPTKADVACACPLAREVAAGRFSDIRNGDEVGIDAGEEGDAEKDDEDWGC